MVDSIQRPLTSTRIPTVRLPRDRLLFPAWIWVTPARARTVLPAIR